jgi:hypothetical protein
MGDSVHAHVRRGRRGPLGHHENRPLLVIEPGVEALFLAEADDERPIRLVLLDRVAAGRDGPAHLDARRHVRALEDLADGHDGRTLAIDAAVAAEARREGGRADLHLELAEARDLRRALGALVRNQLGGGDDPHDVTSRDPPARAGDVPT